MQLAFDNASHTYTLDGTRVPSVTQVLQLLDDYSGVPPQLLEAARVFGQHVHEATHLSDVGELDVAKLDPALLPYLQAWERFVEDEQVVVIESELQVSHSRLRYAGTLDRRFIWRDAMWLADIKSGALPCTVGPQTAAYEQAWRDTSKSKLLTRRCCVQLNPDFPKGYKVHVLKDPADFNHFLSALNCYRFREKHHGHA